MLFCYFTFCKEIQKDKSEVPVENVGISDSSDSEMSHDPEADHSIAHATDGQEAASCHSADDHPSKGNSPEYGWFIKLELKHLRP